MYVTKDIPGIGGALKVHPDDFVVEEVLAEQLEGKGPYVWMLLEKRGLSTQDCVAAIAGGLSLSAGEIGVGGRKDVQALTRQWISLPKDRLKAGWRERLQLPLGARIEEMSEHDTKLRRGRIGGNRFEIRVRELSEPDLAATRIERGATQLATRGFPNFYGTQRFVNSAALDRGVELLRGSRKRVREPRFTVSVAQSAIFNRWLGRRLEEDPELLPKEGDVVLEEGHAAHFTPGMKGVLSGPMVGLRMKWPKGERRKLEEGAMAEFGLVPADLIDSVKVAPGTRRAALAQIRDLVWRVDKDEAFFSFVLPSGSYATVLMGEFMKVPALRPPHVEADGAKA